MNNRTIAVAVIVAVVFLATLAVVQNAGGNSASLIKDPTNQSYTIANLGIPSLREQAFDTKARCQTQGGVINWTGNGTLLTCDRIVPFDAKGPEPVLFTEMADIQARIDSGLYSPTTEKERLALYFQIVYPNSPPATWTSMSEKQLVDYWRGLEVYYKLPAAIQPQTQIRIHRRPGYQFYRIPDGVLLDQDPERRGVLGSYIEVIRFGSMYNMYSDPALFPGTFYYPAKGSGLFLPLGRTLIAYNKVHAMKLLGAENADICRYGGRDFQAFLDKDSKAYWNTSRGASEARVTACVVYKAGETIDPNCADTPKIARHFTTRVTYSPTALAVMIDEMVSGKSLRYLTKNVSGEVRPYLTYYGCGDTGDAFVSQLGRNRGYTTIQCLREGQNELGGDAVVGNEVIHLVENAYSQASLMRLDPTKMPLYLPPGIAPEYPINYLLDPTVKPVDLRAVISTEFQPFRQSVLNIAVVVPERN